MTTNEALQHEQHLHYIISKIGFYFLGGYYNDGKAFIAKIGVFGTNLISKKDLHYLQKFQYPFKIDELQKTVKILDNS